MTSLGAQDVDVDVFRLTATREVRSRKPHISLGMARSQKFLRKAEELDGMLRTATCPPTCRFRARRDPGGTVHHTGAVVAARGEQGGNATVEGREPRPVKVRASENEGIRGTVKTIGSEHPGRTALASPSGATTALVTSALAPMDEQVAGKIDIERRS